MTAPVLPGMMSSEALADRIKKLKPPHRLDELDIADIAPLIDEDRALWAAGLSRHTQSLSDANARIAVLEREAVVHAAYTRGLERGLDSRPACAGAAAPDTDTYAQLVRAQDLVEAWRAEFVGLVRVCFQDKPPVPAGWMHLERYIKEMQSKEAKATETNTWLLQCIRTAWNEQPELPVASRRALETAISLLGQPYQGP